MGKANWEESPKVEGGKTFIFEGDFEKSAHCSAVSTATANAGKPGRKRKICLILWGEGHYLFCITLDPPKFFNDHKLIPKVEISGFFGCIM